MRNPLSRRPRRPEATDPARVVDLAAWNRGDTPVTVIARPDSLSPIDYTMPAMDPNIGDARLTVTQVIGDLAERGALDAGTGDVLDHWIDTQLEEWLRLVDAQAEDRRKTMARLLTQHVDNLVAGVAVLAELRTSFADAEAAAAHWRDQLNGHPAAPPPATLTLTDDRVEPVVAPPPALPAGHLAGLLPQSQP